MEGETRDSHVRSTVRPFRRIRSGAESARLASREIRSKLSRRPERAHVRQPVDRCAQLPANERYPELERHQSAARCVVRSLRQWTDGPQGVDRPLCRQNKRRRLAAAEPNQYVRQRSITSLERRQPQLRAGLRPRQLCRERRVPCAQQPVLRPDQPGRHQLVGRGSSGVGSSRQQLGHFGRDPARAAPGAVIDRRLLSEYWRLLPQHR